MFSPIEDNPDSESTLTKSDLNTLRCIFRKVPNGITILQLAYHIRQHLINKKKPLNKKQEININEYAQSECISHIVLPDNSTARCSVSLRNKYLQFFLQCEVKLKSQKNSDQEWNLVFSRQIGKLQRLLYIVEELKVRVLLRDGLKRIADRARPKIKLCNIFEQRYNNIESKIEKMETSLSELVEYDNIEVQEDVKLKTHCFFKWCRFVQQIKQVRSYRQEEIQNLRKSLNFKTHTLKSVSFETWRECTIRTRKYKHKILEVTNIIKLSAGKQLMTSLRSTLELKHLQNALSSVISNKLCALRKSQFFNSIKINLKEAYSIVASTPSYDNVWCYRFITNVSQGLQQVKTKSLKHIRQSSQSNYSKICLSKALNVLKKISLKNKTKVKQLQAYRKNKQFEKYIHGFRSRRSTNLLNQQLKTYLLKRGIALFASLLTCYRTQFRLQQLKVDSLNKSLKLSSIQKLVETQNQDRNHYNAQEEKTSLLDNYLKDSFQRRFFSILNRKKGSSQKERGKITTLMSTRKTTFFARARELMSLKSSWRGKVQKAVTFWKKIYSCKIMRGFEREKIIRKKQLEALRKVSVFSLKRAIKTTVFVLRNVKDLKNMIGLFCRPIERQLLQKTFRKLFSKSLKINQFIIERRVRVDLQRKSKLFQILKALSSIQQQKIEQIRTCLNNNYERTFFENLTQARNFTINGRKLGAFMQNARKKFTLTILLKIRQTNQQETDRKMKIFGSSFLQKLSSFKKYVHQLKEKQSMCGFKLRQQIKLFSYCKFTENCKRIKCSKVEQKHAIELLRIYITKTQLSFMKDKAQELKRYSYQMKLQRVKKIENIRKKSFFCYFPFPLKEKLAKIKIQKQQKTFVLKNLKQNRYLCNQLRNLCLVKLKFRLKDAVKQRVNRQAISKDEKVKQQTLKQYISCEKSKEAKDLFALMRVRAQINTCRLTIGERLKAKNIVQLIKNIQQMKRGKIKSKSAIIHYARNLKKQVFSAFLIYSLQQKQKQNRKGKSRNRNDSNQNAVKVQKILANSRRSETMTDKISRFNITKSRQVLR